MTMFNSPLEFCSVIRDYVAVDQTERECAAEHGCDPARRCPLAAHLSRGESRGVREAVEVESAL